MESLGSGAGGEAENISSTSDNLIGLWGGKSIVSNTNSGERF